MSAVENLKDSFLEFPENCKFFSQGIKQQNRSESLNQVIAGTALQILGFLSIVFFSVNAIKAASDLSVIKALICTAIVIPSIDCAITGKNMACVGKSRESRPWRQVVNRCSEVVSQVFQGKPPPTLWERYIAGTILFQKIYKLYP